MFTQISGDSQAWKLLNKFHFNGTIRQDFITVATQESKSSQQEYHGKTH
jgi:hypothetical protein